MEVCEACGEVEPCHCEPLIVTVRPGEPPVHVENKYLPGDIDAQ